MPTPAELDAWLDQRPPTRYAAAHTAAERRRSTPQWPFAQLTPHQQRQRAAFERAMREGKLASAEGALL